MLSRVNLELKRGEDGVFEIPLSSSSGSMDISAADAVRVDVFRLGALQAEAPLVECMEANGRIERVTSSGAVVTFRFFIPAAVSASLPVGDYEWRETDLIGGLKTESIGGVLTVV